MVREQISAAREVPAETAGHPVITGTPRPQADPWPGATAQPPEAYPAWLSRWQRNDPVDAAQPSSAEPRESRGQVVRGSRMVRAQCGADTLIRSAFTSASCVSPI